MNFFFMNSWISIFIIKPWSRSSSPVQLVDTPHLEGCIDAAFSQQPYGTAT